MKAVLSFECLVLSWVRRWVNLRNSLNTQHSSLKTAVLCAMLALLASLPAHAQPPTSPNRPIRFIVGFVPGGVADLLARALAQKLTDAWGQQVIIDNRAGGGGVISMQIAAKAAPDGYTILMGSSTQF